MTVSERTSAIQIATLLSRVYVVLALISTIFLLLFMPPFLVSDEDNHSRRAYSAGHGGWVARHTPWGIGAPVDSGLSSVAADFSAMEERTAVRYPVAGTRPDGRLSLGMLADHQPVGWSHRREFSAFPNTAAYPPTLYVPQMLGWRVTEALNLTILHSLFCVRLFTAVISIGIGWLALRLGRVNPWLLTAYLLLPTVMCLVVSSSQDALLVTLAALAAAMLSRAVAEDRSFVVWEWIVATAILASMAMARPPYLLLAPAVFLPSLDLKAVGGVSGGRRSLAPWVALVLVTGGLLAWQAASPSASSYVGGLPGVNPKLQAAFLVSHPLRGGFNIVAGTLSAAPHMIVKALYSLGWNDIYPPKAVYGVLMLSLTGLCLVSDWKGLPSRRARGLLFFCVLSSMLAISVAEYLIWTAVGAPKLTGLVARYYLPFVPFVLLLSSAEGRASESAGRTGWFLYGSATLFCLVLLTPPWVLSHRFYGTGPIAVLKVALR